MEKLKNPMDIFKLLDKSNCRECGKPTCLAFAAAVYQGQKQLGECTHLDKAVVEQYSDNVSHQQPVDQEREQAVEDLRKSMASVDLAEVAEKIGGTFKNGKLTIKCLGKDISVDHDGNVYTDIHVHSWLMIPVFGYIIKGSGVHPSGKWVPFRELKGGKKWYRLFEQRSEKPLKRVADTYTDLFEDMIHLFNGRQVEKHYESDISLVLHPLPHVPILICYWKPDDEMESDLNIFFDSTVEEIINIESLYVLTAGLIIMFERLALRHG